MLSTAGHGDAGPRAPVLLLVEDHVDTRQMYAEFLRPQFLVVQAGDGATALDLIRIQRPDILVTDVSLPGIDGLQLASSVRADPALAHIPIICVSGYGGWAHDTSAEAAGCDRMLQKPCMPDLLADTAIELLRASSSRSVQP